MARWWRRKRKQAEAEQAAEAEAEAKQDDAGEPDQADKPDEAAKPDPATPALAPANPAPKASRTDADEAVRRLLEGASSSRPAARAPTQGAADAAGEQPEKAAPQPAGAETASGASPPAAEEPAATPEPPATPATTAEAAPAVEDRHDESSGELSELATKVQHLLESAEAAAAAIRREAELDAERLGEERERQQLARQEIRHLLRLADSLSVQAEMVQRQCGVLEGLLEPHASEEEPPEAARPADEPGTEPEVRDLRPGRAKQIEPPPAVGRERVEAYRMKLAGAPREEVEQYLERAKVPDPRGVTAEIFEPLRKSGSKG